jgi:hypothetical protein
MIRRRLAAFGVLLVAACSSLAMRPSTALAHPPGGFGVQCLLSHVSKDDPIVHPGHHGMSHRHAFYGNTSTDAHSTRASLMRARTTCTDAKPPKDLAATWFPTAMFNKDGRWRPVTAWRERTYYFPSIRDNLGVIEDLPANIRLIGGNPDAKSWRQNPDVSWFCGEGSPVRPFPYDCRPYTLPNEDGIRAIIAMPYCWDGVTLDSGAAMTHVVYGDPKDRSPHTEPAPCPAGHPFNIPSVSVRAHFKLKDPCAGLPCAPRLQGKNVQLKLSSGPWWTMHADFWNTWVQSKLNSLTDRCLRGHIECGILGEVERDL